MLLGQDNSVVVDPAKNVGCPKIKFYGRPHNKTLEMLDF